MPEVAPHNTQKTTRVPNDVANGQITKENIPDKAEAIINMFSLPTLSPTNPKPRRATAPKANKIESKLLASVALNPISAAYSICIKR